MSDTPDPNAIAKQLETGGEAALAELFTQYRDRLWRMVHYRLDSRLHGRVDADDVLQEAYVNAVSRVYSFLQDPTRSFFVWLRLVVNQTLVDVHRRHLGSQMRDAGREVTIGGVVCASASSMSMAAFLIGDLTSPSRVAMRNELAARLDEALAGMDKIDREVLVLRHFEELSNKEVAEVLGIEQKAASIRYIRAIARLKDILEAMPGMMEE